MLRRDHLKGIGVAAASFSFIGAGFLLREYEEEEEEETKPSHERNIATLPAFCLEYMPHRLVHLSLQQFQVLAVHRSMLGFFRIGSIGQSFHTLRLPQQIVRLDSI
jgi:hypothetical protein